MKPMTKLFTSLIAFVLLAVPWGFSQGTTTLPNPGKYGATAWAVNNQRVASQFNYYIDSLASSGLGAYTFPPSVIYQAVPKGSQGFAGGSAAGTPLAGPFNTNATVKVIDVVSANTETVAITANSCGTGAGVSSACTLSLSTSNAHSSYILRSGTCGLREALNDLNGQGGEVIVDQRFYDDGCTAATITGLTFSATTPPMATQLIHDISNNQDAYYSIQPATVSQIGAPTTSANLTCATTAGLVCQSATTGGTWPNSAEIVGEIYVDALGQWSIASTTATLTPGASGTNVLQYNSPAASTGAVGWLPWGGATYNSATYVLPVTATNCTLSTVMTLYPVCAIGANAQITTPVVTGSLIPNIVANTFNPNPMSHTTFAYGLSRKPVPYETSWGPFTATAALTAGQKGVVGSFVLPFSINQIESGFHVYGEVAGTTTTGAGTATGVQVQIQANSHSSSGAPIDVCAPTISTSTSTAVASTWKFDCYITTTAIGASGTLMPDGFGAFNSTVAAASPDTLGAAATVDLTALEVVDLVFVQTTSAETGGVQLMDLHFEPIN